MQPSEHIHKHKQKNQRTTAQNSQNSKRSKEIKPSKKYKDAQLQVQIDYSRKNSTDSKCRFEKIDQMLKTEILNNYEVIMTYEI